MNTKSLLPQTFAVLAVLLWLVVSCNKPQDVPPPAQNDTEVNMTIAELQALYTVSNDIPYQEIPMGTVISGIVTSCDKEKKLLSVPHHPRRDGWHHDQFAQHGVIQ